jgi:hypothetical protein
VTPAAGSPTALAALEYAGRGWAVFPCHAPGAGGLCSCRHPDCPSPGKHPRVPTGLHAATTDQATIAAWWRRWPAANVAIRTGAASGLVVIDIDPPHGGDVSLAGLTARHPDDVPAVSVRTGSGGSHIYVAHPGGLIRNTAGRLGDGIDVRGDGGYVIAPPSWHPSGGTYAWVGSGPTIGTAPDWLVAALQPPAPPFEPVPSLATPPVDASAWARAALQRELDLIRNAPLGKRNATLNRASFCLGQIAAGGCLDADEVTAVLVAAGTGIGLGERESRLTVASGMAAGSRSPRRPTAPTIGGVAPRASPALPAAHRAAAVPPRPQLPEAHTVEVDI